jgi:hypothetical protein
MHPVNGETCAGRIGQSRKKNVNFFAGPESVSDLGP